MDQPAGPNSTGTGATTATYTPSSAIPGTTYYRVLVNASNNGCDQAVSNTATAVIAADLVVTTQPTDVHECVGGTDQMSVTVSGGSGTITINGSKVLMEVQVGQTQQVLETLLLLIRRPVQPRNNVLSCTSECIEQWMRPGRK
jgi:hypothetical protein